MASSGSQPIACVASTTVSAPWWRAASAIVVERGDLAGGGLDGATATTSVVASIASASRSSGTTSTVTPRPACARNGNSSDTNSGSGASTRAPSGIAAATCAIRPETVAPTATRSASAPTSVANSARARPVTAVQCSQLTRPARQSACAVCTASHTGSGGSPKLAVFR